MGEALPLLREKRSLALLRRYSFDPVPEPLANWQRPHFIRPGGTPFLFYVVFGQMAVGAPLAAQKYRVGNIPAELEIRSYDAARHGERLDSFRGGYLWADFNRDAPELARRVAGEEACIVLRGEFTDAATLDHLRDTVGLITHFLDHGGVAVYDPQMLRWWSPTLWREKIFDPAAPVPRHQVVILVSPESTRGEWIHTRGLRKFGRPDLSIRAVTPELKPGVIELCNRLIEFQALGGIIDEGREITMAGLPRGLRCHHRGDLDDPEFNNVHVAIER